MKDPAEPSDVRTRVCRAGQVVGVVVGVAAAAMLAATFVGDGDGVEVLDVSQVPGQVRAQRLADGAPVFTVRDGDGEVMVLDARAPPAGAGVRLLLVACDGEPLLTRGRTLMGFWTLEGAPVDLGAAPTAYDAPDPPESLIRYQVEGTARGAVVRIGDAMAGPTEPAAPASLPDPRRCQPDAVDAHEPLAEQRTLADLRGADDGRYGVEATVEQVGDGPARLCHRPADPGLMAGDVADGRGFLPICGDDAVVLGGSRVQLPGVPHDPFFAVAWVGTLEIAMHDGAVAEVAVPADATWLAGVTGGEIVVRGELVTPAADHDRVGAIVAPPRTGPAAQQRDHDLVLRRAEIVDAPDGAPEAGLDPAQLPLHTPLWLADDAALTSPDHTSVTAGGFSAAVDRGDLDDTAYRATIDRVTGETVMLAPAD